MNHQPKSSADTVVTSLLFRGGLALLVLVAWLTATANGQSEPENPAANSPLHVTHVLGFEDVRRNAGGELSIQGDNLRFQREGSPAAQISLSSIQNVSLGEQDKQVGGVPMMLGKSAVPYGGGRVVSLFSHKKYDSLAIEYVDMNGGFHGAIFRLGKGQGQIFKDSLIAHGAQITSSEDRSPLQSTPAESLEAAQWSVYVDRVDAGDTNLDPSFSDAIYENLLRDLPKSRQFKNVFRSGDRNANNASSVLVLKILVEKYSPGSETKRAVTTVAGTTKLKVDIQLLARDGNVVLNRTVDGNVRFFGDNLGVTNKVANKTAKTLKQSTLPAPAALLPQQTIPKEAKSTI